MARAPFQVIVIPFRKARDDRFEYAIFKRSDARYWQSIAGGGEDSESPIEAAKREAYEEASIHLTAKFYSLDTLSYVPTYHFAARREWPKDLYVIPNYCFATDASNVEIALSYEHTKYKWVNYAEANRLLHWDDNKTALWELSQRLWNGNLPPPI